MNAKELKEKVIRGFEKNAKRWAEQFVDENVGETNTWSFTYTPDGSISVWKNTPPRGMTSVFTGCKLAGIIGCDEDTDNEILSFKDYLLEDDTELFQDVVGEDFDFWDEDDGDGNKYDIDCTKEFLYFKYSEEDNEQAQKMFDEIKDKNLCEILKNPDRQDAIKEIIAGRERSYEDDYIPEYVSYIEDEILRIAYNLPYEM